MSKIKPSKKPKEELQSFNSYVVLLFIFLPAAILFLFLTDKQESNSLVFFSSNVASKLLIALIFTITSCLIATFFLKINKITPYGFGICIVLACGLMLIFLTKNLAFVWRLISTIIFIFSSPFLVKIGKIIGNKLNKGKNKT